MRNILYFLLILLIPACKKSGADNSTPAVTANAKTINEATIDTAKIYGSWKLINYSGGLAGGKYIPTVLTVVEFDRDRTVKYYSNSVLLAQDKYTVQLGASIFSNSPIFQIQYAQNIIKKAIIKAKTDTLELADDMYDGYYYVYTK